MQKTIAFPGVIPVFPRRRLIRFLLISARQWKSVAEWRRCCGAQSNRSRQVWKGSAALPAPTDPRRGRIYRP